MAIIPDDEAYENVNRDYSDRSLAEKYQLAQADTLIRMSRPMRVTHEMAKTEPDEHEEILNSLFFRLRMYTYSALDSSSHVADKSFIDPALQALEDDPKTTGEIMQLTGKTFNRLLSELRITIRDMEAVWERGFPTGLSEKFLDDREG